MKQFLIVWSIGTKCNTYILQRGAIFIISVVCRTHTHKQQNTPVSGLTKLTELNKSLVLEVYITTIKCKSKQKCNQGILISLRCTISSKQLLDPIPPKFTRVTLKQLNNPAPSKLIYSTYLSDIKLSWKMVHTTQSEYYHFPIIQNATF